MDEVTDAKKVADDPVDLASILYVQSSYLEQYRITNQDPPSVIRLLLSNLEYLARFF